MLRRLDCKSHVTMDINHTEHLELILTQIEHLYKITIYFNTLLVVHGKLPSLGLSSRALGSFHLTEVFQSQKIGPSGAQYYFCFNLSLIIESYLEYKHTPV